MPWRRKQARGRSTLSCARTYAIALPSKIHGTCLPFERDENSVRGPSVRILEPPSYCNVLGGKLEIPWLSDSQLSADIQ